jgi:hypothetical protein
MALLGVETHKETPLHQGTTHPLHFYVASNSTLLRGIQARSMPLGKAFVTNKKILTLEPPKL